MRKTAIYRDDLFLEHKTGAGHPESPERLAVIFEELDKEETANNFIYPGFDPASLDSIALNHSEKLVARVASTAGKTHDFLDADTQTSARSFDAACLAVGALVDGVNRLVNGEIDNCFALVRPPGHHAEFDRSMGFCLFNNIAVAAKYAREHLGIERIFIMDWDLHHGNGTQNSFYDTDQVLYCSTHQYPYYPGTGGHDEIGKGDGRGYTVNVPLPGGQDDLAYATIFNRLVAPLIREYKPQLIMVSCGFDIYQGDPLGAMQVTPAGFAYLTRTMVSLAEEVCNGHLLVTLEGGYNLTGMRDGALAVLTELVGKELNTGYPVFLNAKIATELAEADIPLMSLEQALERAKKNWKL